MELFEIRFFYNQLIPGLLSEQEANKEANKKKKKRKNIPKTES
jgi:hypothetical protein